MSNAVINDTLYRQLSYYDDPVIDAASSWFANNWVLVAIAGFSIILLIVLRNVRDTKGNRKKDEVKKEALSESVDFNNIVNSAFHSTELYDQLKVQCHPDRFTNDSQKEVIAMELFQLINQNRNNVKALEKLKTRAKEELNVSI